LVIAGWPNARYLKPHARDAAPTTPCINLCAVAPKGLSTKALPFAVSYLARAAAKSGSPCLAVRISRHDAIDAIDELIRELIRLDVGVLVIAHHDVPALEQMQYHLLAGVIIENACILPDGERRDYFRSSALRRLMSRCAGERARDGRADFFVGFLDLWEQQPSVAVVRRAAKLAGHFRAVLEHGPANPAVVGCLPPLPAVSITGFEYLRRPEITDVG
jgi:hypothetical protein